MKPFGYPIAHSGQGTPVLALHERDDKDISYDYDIKIQIKFQCLRHFVQSEYVFPLLCLGSL